MSITSKTAPTAYQLEQAASLWMQLANQMREDDELRPDEAEIERRIRDMGYRTPSDMLSALIDVAVVMGQKADHAEHLRKRYADKRDRYRARQERTRATVNQLMELMNTQAHEGELGSASYAKAHKHVIINDLKLVPPKFVTIQEPVPDKNAIRTAINAGEVVPGAEYGAGNEPPVLKITPY